MENSFFIHLKRKFVRVNFDEINYVLSIGHHVKIHTAGAVYVPHLGMKQVEDLLPKDRFIRVNRSALVPLSRITSFTNDEVFLGELSFAISELCREELRSRLKVVLHI
jgi:DNA-binding LytR/AlgR family response regulator